MDLLGNSPSPADTGNGEVGLQRSNGGMLDSVRSPSDQGKRTKGEQPQSPRLGLGSRCSTLCYQRFESLTFRQFRSRSAHVRLAFEP